AGKRADIIAVRTDTPRMTPLFGDGRYFNLQHNLVHAVRGGDVAMTMVDGQILVEDGVLKTADLSEINADIRKLAPGHFARPAAAVARALRLRLDNARQAGARDLRYPGSRRTRPPLRALWLGEDARLGPSRSRELSRHGPFSVRA